ncbi:oligosaccharide flippase family protein [Pediococcus acidilactici]|uniref:oligosaccharide flippase family protein n=1 Tax=Pediococcus acidilactici TaxID=1254 RepID=UPI00132B913A|nr:polysaccharide biosynthesis C-terminal domain-containing protein [Pediococcus acidilactici]KAF0334020.1 oligosaccharide flippase family protein [Pediococcus acidilactici]KAF0343768.1 oligosaccharide flippase family protein [Pediococcus acidilactici]KAF0353587.1 oligosaccharide flippase family protein [Pediococcus acidilactici]KAF0357924.1 oligosaccharide flippase family protein [Pediococcus acidilactici]KAF0362086.1 oligosaccharide flippase family protein [Pediococcus acidilactici]
MKVVKNYLYNAFYQIFVLLVPLVTTPYLSRVLGPQGVGINSYTNSIIQYFILAGSIGIGMYGNRQIAFVRDNKEELTKTFYEIFFLRIITIAIAYVFFLVFLLLTKEYRLYYIAQSISIIAAAFDISWFFMGVENFAVTIFRNLVIKILSLICIFTSVKSFDDLFIYIAILSLSLLLGNLTLFPSLKRYVGKVDWKKLNVLKHLGPSISLFIPQIAIQIYLVVNKTMLGSLDSVVAAGYFDQSDKVVKLVLAIVTATGTVMLPHVANAYMRGDIAKTKQSLYNSFSFVTALSVPMMFGLMAVVKKFVPLFFSNRFRAVIPLMQMESIVILIIAWGSALGVQYLLPTNQNKSYTLSVVLGAIVNIVMNVPLILFLGAFGSTIATVCSEMAVSGYQLFAIRQQISYKKLFHDFGKYMLAGFLMFVCVVFLDNKLSCSWISLGIEVVMGALIYLGMLLILKVDILGEAKKILKKK